MGWYRFDDFEIDVDKFVLKRGDRVQPLQPKVFDVLRYLVERHGKVVTKGELLREIWHDGNVNESAIAWSVSHIRRALGQRSGRNPIETIPTRGYRFTADVTQGDSVASQDERSVAPIAARRPSVLVGRAQVMAELELLVRETNRGHGALRVITGPAGIGKTRCADELAAIARDSGARVLWGRCPHDPAVPPLWPVAAAIRGLAQEQPELVAKMQSLVASAAGDGASPAERHDGTRFWLIERAAQLLHEAAATRPTLLILDDLHWADAGSVDLLGFIAPDLRDMQLCIVATLRNDENPPGSALDQPLRRMLSHARAIPLAAFDATEVADFAQDICNHRPSRELAEAMRRAADGVPLFVQEIVRSLLREHGAKPLDTLTPESIHPPALALDLLRERVKHLPAATTDVLSSAAVIGETFDLSLLLALLELEPEVLLERLEPAIAEGQLQCDVPHAYRFVHTLFQTVLYEDLPVAQRVAIHRRLGMLLLARPAVERRDAEIARHFYLSLPAGEPERVAELARAAGDAAMREFAHENAVVYYGWALNAQMFSGTTEVRERAELLLVLATAQRLAGRTGDALETTSRLLEIAQRQPMGDIVVRATRLRRPTVAMAMVPDALACSALEAALEREGDAKSAVRVSALSQLACIPPYSTDLSRSKQLSAHAVELAHELSGTEPMFQALRARLFALSGPDDIEQVLEVANGMLSTRPEARANGHASDAMAARYSAHILSGRMPEADAVLQTMSAAISGQHWPEATFFCERLATQRRFLDGHFEEADQRWKTLHARAVRAGVSYAGMFYGMHSFNLALEREGAKAIIARPPLSAAPMATWTPYTRAGMARIAAEAGQHELARGQLSAIGDPEMFPRDGHYLYLLANFATCAACIVDKPRCEQLFALLEAYDKLNTPSQMAYYLGSVAHFLGLLADALGRTSRASAYFAYALERNRTMGYRAGVVRTLLAHGQLETRLGHERPARELLTRARDEAAAIGMNGARLECDAALRSV